MVTSPRRRGIWRPRPRHQEAGPRAQPGAAPTPPQGASFLRPVGVRPARAGRLRPASSEYGCRRPLGCPRPGPARSAPPPLWNQDTPARASGRDPGRRGMRGGRPDGRTRGGAEPGPCRRRRCTERQRPGLRASRSPPGGGRAGTSVAHGAARASSVSPGTRPGVVGRFRAAPTPPWSPATCSARPLGRAPEPRGLSLWRRPRLWRRRRWSRGELGTCVCDGGKGRKV